MPAPPPQALPPSHGRSSCVSQTQYVRIRWRLPGPWFSLATPNQTPPRSGKQPRRGSVLGTRTNSTRAPLDAQLAEQTRNRDHNSTDECGQARKQQKVTQQHEHARLPLPSHAVPHRPIPSVNGLHACLRVEHKMLSPPRRGVCSKSLTFDGLLVSKIAHLVGNPTLWPRIR